jgi:hypothetical protein
MRLLPVFRSRRAGAATAPAAILLLAVLGACGGRETPALPPPDAVYELRGEIVKLPAEPGGELWIHHEAIPSFRGSDGELTGMEAMTMPFTHHADDPLELAGLAVGDRIAFRLEVRWQGEAPPAMVTGVRKLPDGTRLEFDPAPAPAAEGAAAAAPGAAAEPAAPGP